MIYLGIFSFSLLLAIIVSYMFWTETRKFDSNLLTIRTGMTEDEITARLGRPSITITGDKELKRYQSQQNEWYSDFEIPVELKNTALVFTANERKAYIYLDRSGHVDSILIAKKGRQKRFEVFDKK